jgi:4-amino-4-deoxy-L-arabinose transferase-like glycosyltransferase
MSTSPLRGLLLVAGVWAAIYLPWLGTPELRSEEGHRVLPAVEMLETGNFLVPHVGGVPYLRKPPLVNWVVAAAFKVSGARNEWAARLPSAIAVFAAALVFLIGGRAVLGSNAALVASIAWLTNLGMIEKGRMIEIDALYVSLFAIAIVLWLVWWQQDRSPWLTWIGPWIFLGLATLAKGPAHLLFFYAVVVAVLWRTHKLRELLQPAHLVGIVVSVGMFAAWAVPCFRAVHEHSISQTWSYELALRITGGENDATDWPMNFPRGLGYFLPWLIVLPFVRPGKMANLTQQQIASGLVCGALVPFVVTLLLPGTIARYILPTLVPACWLIGMAIHDNAFSWSVALGPRIIRLEPRLLWSFVAVFAIAAAIIFPVRSATFLKHRPKVKPIAAKVNAVVPTVETLYALNPLFQPYFFYLHCPVRYPRILEDLPKEARYLVTSPEEKAHIDSTAAWVSLRPQLLVATPEYRGHSTLVFRLAR